MYRSNCLFKIPQSYTHAIILLQVSRLCVRQRCVLSYDSTLKRAKRSKSCLSPAFLKRMVAFALSPSPSTFKTSPRPKRSCSISCPCCTRLADAPAEGDVLAVFAEGATRFRLRGTVGAIICCFGRTDTHSFPPYGASSLSGAKPLAFSLRKTAASSSTLRNIPAS